MILPEKLMEAKKFFNLFKSFGIRFCHYSIFAAGVFLFYVNADFQIFSVFFTAKFCAKVLILVLSLYFYVDCIKNIHDILQHKDSLMDSLNNINFLLIMQILQ